MNVRLIFVSDLSPLLFIAVAEIICRKTSTLDIIRKLLYADDLTVVANNEDDLIGGMGGNIWPTWMESKFGEEASSLIRAAEQRFRYKTGNEESGQVRQVFIHWYSRAKEHDISAKIIKRCIARA